MKILVCDKTEAEAIERLRAAGLDVDVRDEISPEELEQVVHEYHGLIVRSRTKVRASLIDKAVNLRVIVRGGVGLDTIDADYARSKGITVMNTPGASSRAVAELTLAFMLALARQIVQTTNSMRAGLWEKKKFEGTELCDKILGIVGMGRIGMEVARIGSALGMDVVVYDPYIQHTDEGEMTSLEDLLRSADYITFHLPLTDETRNMIGREQFAMMKPGVCVINCARGGVIDEDALYDALVEGKVAGAALDVFINEPVHNHKLFTLENVIGSPHIGAVTQEAQNRIGTEVADRLIDFFKK